MTRAGKIWIALVAVALLASGIAGCGQSGTTSTSRPSFASSPASLTNSTSTTSLTLRDPQGYTATFVIHRGPVTKDNGSPAIHNFTFKDPATCAHNLSAPTAAIGIEPFVATITNTTKGFPVTLGVNLAATNPDPATFNFSVGYAGPGYPDGECDPLSDSQGAAFNANSLPAGVSANFYGFVAIYGYYSPAVPQGRADALRSGQLQMYVNNDLPNGQNFSVTGIDNALRSPDGERLATDLLAPG